MRVFRPLVLSVLLTLAPAAAAQGFDLRNLLTSFLRQGITLAPPAQGPSHEAHFIGADNAQFLALDQFNTLVANQLSSFPVASSAGGFTYRFDPALGVFTRSSDSFGPIYSERGETIGAGKFNFGLNYSHYTFDYLDSIDLRRGSIGLVFQHMDLPPLGTNLYPFFEGDLITAQLSLKLETNITAIVLTYGATDRLDVGLAVPVVDVKLDAISDVQIQRLATGPTMFNQIHRFLNGGTAESISQSGSARGVGDILARGKFAFLRSDRAALAVAGEVRIPTGDDRDLLGTGATQFRASLIGSIHLGVFSPHINAGYAVSTRPTGRSTPPDEIAYAMGVDVALHPRLTFVADVIGRDLRNTQRVKVLLTEYTANANGSFDVNTPPVLVHASFPRLTVEPAANVNALNGSVGVKFNPFGSFLLTLNGLFSLNHSGLQDTFTPLLAADYSF